MRLRTVPALAATPIAELADMNSMTAEDQRRLDHDEVCAELAGQEWVEDASMFAHDILIQEVGQCPFCGESV